MSSPQITRMFGCSAFAGMVLPNFDSRVESTYDFNLGGYPEMERVS
jgi:hypothetical protein